jgi:hypothetical protein
MSWLSAVLFFVLFCLLFSLIDACVCVQFPLQLELLTVARRLSDADSWPEVEASVHCSLLDCVAGLGADRVPECLAAAVNGSDGMKGRDRDNLCLSVASLSLNTGSDLGKVRR